MTVNYDFALPPAGGADLAVAVDQASFMDLAGPVESDLSRPGDGAVQLDMALRSDLAIPFDSSSKSDLAMPPDRGTPPDLAAPRDLTTPPDLTPPPDLLVKSDLEINYCVVQSPKSAATQVNKATQVIYGQVFQMGLTDKYNNGPAPGIKAQLGYGPSNTDPRNSDAWKWLDTIPNPDPNYNWALNNDEYQTTITPSQAGTFWYVFRFTVTNGAGYTYCDTVGNGSNNGLPAFDPAKSGVLTVN